MEEMICPMCGGKIFHYNRASHRYKCDACGYEWVPKNVIDQKIQLGETLSRVEDNLKVHRWEEASKLARSLISQFPAEPEIYYDILSAATHNFRDKTLSGENAAERRKEASEAWTTYEDLQQADNRDDMTDEMRNYAMIRRSMYLREMRKQSRKLYTWISAFFIMIGIAPIMPILYMQRSLLPLLPRIGALAVLCCICLVSITASSGMRNAAVGFRIIKNPFIFGEGVDGSSLKSNDGAFWFVTLLMTGIMLLYLYHNVLLPVYGSFYSTKPVLGMISRYGGIIAGLVTWIIFNCNAPRNSYGIHPAGQFVGSVLLSGIVTSAFGIALTIAYWAIVIILVILCFFVVICFFVGISGG